MSIVSVSNSRILFHEAIDDPVIVVLVKKKCKSDIFELNVGKLNMFSIHIHKDTFFLITNLLDLNVQC